jgi:hypothetical protein
MADNADKVWKDIVGGSGFILRTHISEIRGYAKILKTYADQHEGRSLIIFEDADITLDMAVKRILASVDQLALLETQLRAELQKSHGETEGRNSDTER